MAVLLTGSVLFANAQTATKSPDQRAARQVKMLQKNLNLDATQSDKISAILTTRATKVDSLRSNPSADKRSNRQALKALMQTTDDQVNAVLTPDQQQTYAKLKEERKSRIKKGADQTQDTPPPSKG